MGPQRSECANSEAAEGGDCGPCGVCGGGAVARHRKLAAHNVDSLGLRQGLATAVPAVTAVTAFCQCKPNARPSGADFNACRPSRRGPCRTPSAPRILSNALAMRMRDYREQHEEMRSAGLTTGAASSTPRGDDRQPPMSGRSALFIVAAYLAVAFSLTQAGTGPAPRFTGCDGVEQPLAAVHDHAQELRSTHAALRQLMDGVARSASRGNIYIWYDEDLYFDFNDLLRDGDGSSLTSDYRDAWRRFDDCVAELAILAPGHACVAAVESRPALPVATDQRLNGTSNQVRMAAEALKSATGSVEVREGRDSTQAYDAFSTASMRMSETVGEYVTATSPATWQTCLAALDTPVPLDEEPRGVLRRVRDFFLRLLGYLMFAGAAYFVIALIRAPRDRDRTAGRSMVNLKRPFGPKGAEEAVADWAVRSGWSVTGQASGGADGGIDVETSRLAIQVKATSRPVGRPVVQNIFGVATARGKQAAVVATSGFTSAARSWATSHGVALFLLKRDGVKPVSPAAENIARSPSAWR